MWRLGESETNDSCSSLLLINPTTLWKKPQRALTQWQNSEEMGKIYQVVVHGIRGEKKTIDLCNTEEQMKSLTVKQLREKIAERIPETAGMFLVLYFLF